MTDIAGLIERLNRLALTTFDTDHPEDEDLFREAATALAELQGKLEAAKKRVEVLEQMDREAATYVESVICMRSNRFTGETPYVGWKGLGLALTEDYADLFRLKALLAEAGEAFKPFAEQAYRHEPDQGDGECTAWSSALKIRDLRRAAAIMEKINAAIR